MEWIEPKTDWKVEYDENGNYIGDYLNVKDLNRMLNNISRIIQECTKLYGTGDEWPIKPPDTPTIGEILDIKVLIYIEWCIQAINKFVRSEEVADIVEEIRDYHRAGLIKHQHGSFTMLLSEL